jgi:hypothetical protein
MHLLINSGWGSQEVFVERGGLEGKGQVGVDGRYIGSQLVILERGLASPVFAAGRLLLRQINLCHPEGGLCPIEDSARPERISLGAFDAKREERFHCT